MNMEISVVIPVRNREKLVVRTLDSVAAQSYRPINLILVDNGSTDATREVLEQWQSENQSDDLRVTILGEPTPGAARARNRGLREVATDYVMFFDSDDEMRPDHIRRVVDELRRLPDADILRWPVAVLDPDGWTELKDQRFHDEMQLHLLHATLATQRYAVRSDLLRRLGGWNESLPCWNDLELGVRLIASGAKIRRLSGEPSVVIHPTEDSITGSDYSSRLDALELALSQIEADFTTPSVTPDNETVVEDVEPDADYLNTLAAKRAILAALLRREGNREASSRLLEAAMKGQDYNGRMGLRMVYRAVRWTGRGGAAVALLWFGKKPPRN